MSEFLKPQSPLQHKDGAYIYPLTTADQVILEDNSRLNVALEHLVYVDEEHQESDKIKTLFSDSAKTEVLFPRTKVNAISDENDISLDVTLNTIKNKLVTDNCIQTSHLQDGSVSKEKLSLDVKESLTSIKLYKGTLLANNWIDELAEIEDYSSAKNKWKWEKFSSVTISSTIRDTLLNATPSQINYILDTSISYKGEMGNSYTARCTTYVYCPEKIDYTCTINTDDAGAVYINGEIIMTTPSVTTTSITIPFKKGVNCLEVFYTEGSGGDGWQFTPALSSRIGLEFSAIYAVPAHSYHQTITPVCLDGNGQINSNTIFFPATVLNNNLKTISSKNKINNGYVIGNDDGNMEVTYSNETPIEDDITMYWLGITIE